MARGEYPLATDIALDVRPGTMRILLRSSPSSDSLAVYSVLIQRKSGISRSTSDCADWSGSSVRTGPGARRVTCTPVPFTSPRSDSLNVFAHALVSAYLALLAIAESPAAHPAIRIPPPF